MAPTKNKVGKQVAPIKSKSARRNNKIEKNKLNQSTVTHGTRASLRLLQRSGNVKTEVECEHPTVKQQDTTDVGAKIGTPEVKNEGTKAEVPKPVKKERMFKVSKPTTKVAAKQTSNEKPKGSGKLKRLEVEEAMHRFANTSLGGNFDKAVEAALLVAQHAGRKTIQLGDVQLARMFSR